MDAEIIAVGSELLTPFYQDTNSLFLTGRLNALGIEVRFKSVVGDHTQDLATVFREALSRTQLIILTGGLGPTEDDLTRPVVAEVLGRALHEDPAIREKIKERLSRFGRPMAENNLRQAMLPEGATWLENRQGTAPGIWIEQDNAIVVLLPGPPGELEAMFDATCMPRLSQASQSLRIRTRVYKVVGLPESEVDKRIAPAYKPYANPVTTILAKPGAIEIHLRARAPSDAEADKLLAELGEQIESALGEYIFSTHGESLEEVVGMYLVMRQKTLAVAESCTGGLLAERLTHNSGSSDFFLGGAICYSNALKTKLTGVPAALIEEHGAVSQPVAQAMAEGIRAREGASLGVSTTGIAGPTGGSAEKPVGLVFIGLADERGTQVREFRFPGNRDRVRLWSTQMALEMIRRRIRG